MEVLDEKVNGGLPMEVEEIVSVRDRELLRRLSTMGGPHLRVATRQTKHLRPSICPTSGMT